MQEHEATGWLDRISLAISRVAMFMTAFVVAIMFYEVVMRYVFASPTLWVNEMSLWVAGAIYLFAGLYVMQQRGHISIFILYDTVPLRVKRVFDVLSTLFTCIFAAAVVWGGFGEAWSKMMRWETFGTAFDPPIPATMKPLILVLVVLTALQSVTNLINDWNSPHKLHDPTDELR